MGDESKNIDVFIERFSQNIQNLVGSLENLKQTTDKLSEQIRNFEINYGRLNIEDRLDKLEEWKEQVAAIWNIEGMKETKKAAADADKLSVRVATIYGVIIFLITAATFIYNILK